MMTNSNRKNLSGVYLRQFNKDTNKYENVCFEELDYENKLHVLENRSKDWLINLIMQLAYTINSITK